MRGMLRLGRWGTSGLLVLMLMVTTWPLQIAPVERVAAQGSRATISFPTDGAVIPGALIPVVWNADEVDGPVVLVLNDAIDVTPGEQLELSGTSSEVSDSPVVIDRLPAGEHTISLVTTDEDLVPLEGVEPTTVTVNVVAPLEASIRQGLCNALGPDAAHELNDLTLGEANLDSENGVIPGTSGEHSALTGVPFARMVAVSDTIVPVPLSELFSRAFTISVTSGGIDGIEDGGSVACGEIGGVVDGSTLRMGLRPQPNSPMYGIATLIDLGDETRVVVETVIAEDAAPDEPVSTAVLGAPSPQNVAIQQGICASLNPDVSTELSAAAVAAGSDDATFGVPFAVPVLTSETTIDESVVDLLGRASSVSVTAEGLADVEDGALAACGEIGGALIDGVLRIGLLPVGGSGVMGTATFYDQGDSTTTVIVEVMAVAGGGATDESEEPEDEVLDTDGDGVLDDVDNCIDLPNPDQLDTDGDGIGDACSEELYDTDGDGVPDVIDNCTFVPNPDQADSDGDGIGDACPPAAPDTDGDGVPDDIDNCTFVPNPDQADSNGDGIGDACTEVPPTDSDGDGFPDDQDNCPWVYNPGQWDDDGDGVGNDCDPDWPGLPTPTVPMEPEPTVPTEPEPTVPNEPQPSVGPGEPTEPADSEPQPSVGPGGPEV